ncbi:MAG: NAD+ synthase [Gammaproteobacteria bacterium]|nr:MAG: NAD+ synthase [Gammaproteobacteria bacterium]
MIRIELAQLNPVVGGMAANSRKIIDVIQSSGADLVVFPELVLTGYPPEDLLLRHDFQEAVQAALQKVARACTDTVAILGAPLRNRNGHLVNAAVVLENGKIKGWHEKIILPNYGVFDEKRYFVSGQTPYSFELKGVRIALAVCEDLWCEDHIDSRFRQEHAEQIQRVQADYAAIEADILVSINASPYHQRKTEIRKQVLSRCARNSGKPIVYVNMTGGQDELVFDGQSMLIDAEGEFIAKMPAFTQGTAVVCFDEATRQFNDLGTLQTNGATLVEETRHTYDALVHAVRDYVAKNGFKGVVMGLSGGIDSALTLAIAADAVGTENVLALLMPSRYTSDISNQEARHQCDQLGVDCRTLPIESPHTAFEELLKEYLDIVEGDLTCQNIQARCRGVMLMAYSNHTGRLLLTTGNKSEMAMGYATLYGDMAGGFAPLKDVSKHWIYRLSEYRNTLSEAIPPGVIERAPSAELAPDQRDSDSLPPYEILDGILESYIEQDRSAEEIIAEGYPEDVVIDVIKRVNRNEYKRRQSPPGPKISRRAFGRERRYPITSAYS